MNLATKFIQIAEERNLFKPHSRVLLGCSGGSDSIALMHLLHRTKRKLKIDEVIIFHVNHGVREDADKDQQFVEEEARKLALSSFSIKINHSEFLDKKNFEEEARMHRYLAYGRISENEGIDVICTAHTADDQAETILMRLFRGTGPLGMKAIHEKRDDQAVGAEIIRPLLAFRKQEIIEWLKHNKIKWVEDYTNHDGSNLRSRIRNIIPILNEAFGRDVVDQIVRYQEIQELNGDASNFLYKLGHQFVEERWLGAADGFTIKPQYLLKPDVFDMPKYVQMSAVRSLILCRDQRTPSWKECEHELYQQRKKK